MTIDYAENYLYEYVGKGYLDSSDIYLKLAAGVAQENSDIEEDGIIKADLKAFMSFMTGNYFDNPRDSKTLKQKKIQMV